MYSNSGIYVSSSAITCRHFLAIYKVDHVKYCSLYPQKLLEMEIIFVKSSCLLISSPRESTGSTTSILSHEMAHKPLEI